MPSCDTMNQELGIGLFERSQRKFKPTFENLRRLGGKVIVHLVQKDLDSIARRQGSLVEFPSHIENMSNSRIRNVLHLFGCFDPTAKSNAFRYPVCVNLILILLCSSAVDPVHGRALQDAECHSAVVRRFQGTKQRAYEPRPVACIARTCFRSAATAP